MERPCSTYFRDAEKADDSSARAAASRLSLAEVSRSSGAWIRSPALFR
jgi:hypothetical protein